MFSPEFSKYLDVDRKSKRFVIKDSFTQEVKFTIPEHIMNFKTEKLNEVASRFVWMDNDTIEVISSEGIQRKIDIVEEKGKPVQFKEVEFNVIPLFDQLKYVRSQTESHYFYDKIELDV